MITLLRQDDRRSPTKATVREHREELVGRVRRLSVVAASVLGLIAGGFWFVQLVRGSHYAELAENNRLRRAAIKAPRGLIYDRAGRTLVENVPSYNLLLDRSRIADPAASLDFAAGVLGRTPDRLAATLDKAAGKPDFVPVTVARNLTLTEVARISAVALEHPEFEVEVHPLRFYRHGRQTAHALGYIGEVSEADLAGGNDYRSGDRVGKEGVEQIYDRLLRGRQGERVVIVDSRGRTLEEHRRRPATPGSSIRLTLDLPLQQTAERLMRDRAGAVVALDPNNGEILALVSAPAYDPNGFARGLGADQWRELLERPDDPLQNRAVRNAYSPGSVFKVVMAAAGLAEGVIDENDRVYCSGSTTIYNHPFACGRRGGHGWVDLEQAIERSCNIYFYHLGQALGIERVARYARAFGLGRSSGIDLAGEALGLVPDAAWSLRSRGTPWYPGETISVAIGQGPLLTTPLQMARMMAAVANGGRLVQPHLVRDPSPETTSERLDVPPELLATIRRGLAAVVNQPDGTAYWAARSPRVEIAGKTGTSQVVARAAAKALGDELPEELRNHGWFVSFAPADHPRLVVAVFAEHGGSGAAGAAPIAKALYEEFFESHPVGSPAG